MRGRVLPIGGLKEKTMAAYRHGIKTVIIPAENQPDLKEVDETVKSISSLSVETLDTFWSGRWFPKRRRKPFPPENKLKKRRWCLR
ncbi:MAG: S16 family serine protease [[Clostridium] leptum]